MTDRQIDKQTGKDRETESQTDRQIDSQMLLMPARHAIRQSGNQTLIK